MASWCDQTWLSYDLFIILWQKLFRHLIYETLIEKISLSKSENICQVGTNFTNFKYLHPFRITHYDSTRNTFSIELLPNVNNRKKN